MLEPKYCGPDKRRQAIALGPVAKENNKISLVKMKQTSKNKTRTFSSRHVKGHNNKPKTQGLCSRDE